MRTVQSWTYELGYGADTMFHKTYFFFSFITFLKNSATGQTRRRIFTHNGSNDADSRKDVPFWEFFTLHPMFDRFSRILARWWSSTLLAVPIVKNYKIRKSKMAVAATLKNLKIAIFRPRFNQFWQSSARWSCSSTLLTVSTVKILTFQKSKMAAAAILKNQKITISQLRFEPFWRDFRQWCTSTLLTNLKFNKSNMAAAAILKNRKLTYLLRGLSDYGKIWHRDVVRPSRPFGSLKM